MSDTDEFPRLTRPIGRYPDRSGVTVTLMPVFGRASHRRPRPWLRRAGSALVLALAGILAVLAIGGGIAHAGTTPQRLTAFYWARTQAGHPYVYGGTGLGYDCSGLVYAAYLHAGIRLPRTTYGMLAAVNNGSLQVTTRPGPGDLAFYGSGHVEFVTFIQNTTFGALEPGTSLWWHHWNSWWHPTVFLHVRGSG